MVPPAAEHSPERLRDRNHSSGRDKLPGLCALLSPIALWRMFRAAFVGFFFLRYSISTYPSVHSSTSLCPSIEPPN